MSSIVVSLISMLSLDSLPFAVSTFELDRSGVVSKVVYKLEVLIFGLSSKIYLLSSLLNVRDDCTFCSSIIHSSLEFEFFLAQ